MKHLIEEVCTKLDRTDLINKIKIVYRNPIIQLYNKFGYCILGCVHIGYLQKDKKKSNKVILQPIFNFISKPFIQEDVIKHELCHVIDINSDNDISIYNGGHGESFNKLMSKIGCNLYSVSDEFIQHSQKKYTYNQKIIFRHSDHTFHAKFMGNLGSNRGTRKCDQSVVE